jgi:quercetin dioxygenase-like cupin family protein
LVFFFHQSASFGVAIMHPAASLNWRVPRIPRPVLSCTELLLAKDHTMTHITPHLRRLFLGLCITAGTLAHAAAPEPVVTALMSKALSDYPGKEVQMITVDYVPGAADPIHRHDAHGFIYVLEGSIVMGVKGGKEQTLTAGQTFYEGPQDIHTVGRNASKTKPAKFVVFLLKDKSKPALIPVQHP